MDESGSDSGSSVRSWLGFGLLLLALLPVKFLQASWESSLWIDEIYSLQLSFQPFRQLIDLTAVDAHPPLYYLVVKYWRELGEWIGLDPGVFWARSINVVFWIGLVAAAWFGGRKAMGRSGGTLAAWAIAVNAQIATEIGNLRSYGLAVPALFVCFIVLTLLAREMSAPRMTRKSVAVLWLLYSLCGAAALWSHLLSVFVLLLLGMGWLGIVVRRRAFFSSFAIGGAVAQMGIVLLFLPWGILIPRQYAYFMGRSGDWLSPPTVREGFDVFLYWYSVGDARGMPTGVSALLSFFAIATLALPLIASVAAALRKNPVPGNSAALRAGLCGLGLAISYAILTWAIHRAGIARVFFGPRYSVLAVAMWALGLSGLASWAVARMGWRPFAAWILLLPWFLAASAAQIRSGLLVAPRSLASWLATADRDVVNPRTPLYFMPSELMPFYRKTLKGFDVRPVEALADLDSPRERVAVLDTSIWKSVDTPRNRAAREAIGKGHVSESVSICGNRSVDRTYRIHVLHKFDPDRGRDILRRRFVPDCGPIPPQACSVATPHFQRQFEGWNDFDLDGELTISRWGNESRSVIDFDRPVAAGSYVVHVVGFRRPYPDNPQTLSFRFQGEEGSWKVSQPEGAFEIVHAVRFERDRCTPRLVVRHPVWSPREREGSDDPRRLSFLFSRAWLEPVGQSD